MTETNLLELAKQGDPQAIIALMNKALEPQKITVQVTIKDEGLTITAQSKTIPEQSFFVEYAQKALSKLNLTEIKWLYIRGQVIGSKHAAWRQTINLQDHHALKTPVINSQISVSELNNKLHNFNIFNILVRSREVINTVFLAGILGILIFNLWWQGQPKDVQYEYRIESFEDVIFDTNINRLGDEGWELIFARRALTSGEYSSRGIYECIFRRIKNKN